MTARSPVEDVVVDAAVPVAVVVDVVVPPVVVVDVVEHPSVVGGSVEAAVVLPEVEDSVEEAERADSAVVAVVEEVDSKGEMEKHCVRRSVGSSALELENTATAAARLLDWFCNLFFVVLYI